jgi:hypothetical protein
MKTVTKSTNQILPYSNWKNCLHIANGEIELIATLDVGPRIIRFGYIGGKNEFAEYPEQAEYAGYHAYHSYGGHRLWAAPEIKGWSNHPDNNPVDWKEENDEIILTAPTEQGTKLQKQLRIHLDAQRNHVRMIHTITNRSTNNLTLAPWAISVMASGGRLIVPQEPFVSHAERVLPVRPIVLWGYTEMKDPRWTWGNRFIQLRQDAHAKSVQKFGALTSEGWATYINDHCVFLKRFPFDPKASYPDFGCNAEFFTNQRMLEVESLGPLATLEPEKSTTHQEDWFLFRDIQIGQTEEDIKTAFIPLLKKCGV